MGREFWLLAARVRKRESFYVVLKTWLPRGGKFGGFDVQEEGWKMTYWKRLVRVGNCADTWKCLEPWRSRKDIGFSSARLEWSLI
jgi:hypothetical protein